MNLKKVRIERGYTQTQVAQYLNITKQGYGNYESGKREPDFETLKKISKYFDVSIDYLLENGEKGKPTTDKGDEPRLETEDEKVNRILIDLFSQLPEKGQKSVLQILECLVESQSKQKHEN